MKISLGYVLALLGVVGLDSFVPNFREDLLVPLMLLSGGLLGVSLILNGLRSGGSTNPVQAAKQAPVNYLPQKPSIYIAEDSRSAQELPVAPERINVYSENHGAMDKLSKELIASHQTKKKAGRPKGSRNRPKIPSYYHKSRRARVQVKHGSHSLQMAEITCLV